MSTSPATATPPRAFGLNIADVRSVVANAIGGDNVGETVEGLQRFPISNALLRPVRSTNYAACRLFSDQTRHMLLGDVAAIAMSDGPPCCAVACCAALRLGLRRWRARSEEVRGAGHAQQAVAQQVKLTQATRCRGRASLARPGARHRQLQRLVCRRHFADFSAWMKQVVCVVVHSLWCEFWLVLRLACRLPVQLASSRWQASRRNLKIMVLYLRQAWDDRLAR
jgi:Cu(I)/Ag(I) efflux system membrane protein CusA/SilA